MKKTSNVFDVDEFLRKNSITVRIRGKEYTITDIPKKVRDLLKAPQADEVEVVSCMLGCPKEDLQDYGMVALNAIIQQVTSHFFPTASLNTPSKSSSEQEQ